MSRKLPQLRRAPRPDESAEDGGQKTRAEAKPAKQEQPTSAARNTRPRAKTASATRSTKTGRTTASRKRETSVDTEQPAGKQADNSAPARVDAGRGSDTSTDGEQTVEVLDPRTAEVAERAEARARRYALAQGIVARQAAWSSAGGLIPLPYANVLAISGAQVAMVASLARLYRVPYSKEAVNTVVGAIVGAATPYALSAGVASLFLKAMPGVGTVIGLATMAGLSNVATRTLGRLFIQHFEAGNDLDDIDTDAMAREYVEQVRRG